MTSPAEYDDALFAGVEAKLSALMRRALAVGLSGAALLVVMLAMLATVLEMGVLLSPDAPIAGIPRFDIPPSLAHNSASLLSGLALVLLLGGVLLRSLAVLRTWQALLAGVLALLLLVVDIWVMPGGELRRPLGLFPSTLEQQVRHQHFELAYRTIGNQNLPPLQDSYLRAQVALRQQDQGRLQQYGQPVLQAADDQLYEVRQTAAQGELAVSVLAAIDLTLHPGHPLSEVGVQYQGHLQQAHNQRLLFYSMLIWTLVVAVLAVLLLRVWLLMGQRIRRINARLQQQAEEG